MESVFVFDFLVEVSDVADDVVGLLVLEIFGDGGRLRFAPPHGPWCFFFCHWVGRVDACRGPYKGLCGGGSLCKSNRGGSYYGAGRYTHDLDRGQLCNTEVFLVRR